MESSLLQKEINSLTEEDPKLRKKALLKLYSAIVIPESPLPPQMAQGLLPKLQKPLLKRLADHSEKCRQLALNILKILIEVAEDMSVALPYMLPVIAERVNAGNLEGYEHLQEKQRPTPPQKPLVMSALVQTSEQIRLQLAQLMTVIVAGSLPQSLAPFLDDLVGSLRALAMDPFGEVISEACRGIGLLCEKATPLLLHFSTNLGRACLTALVHKHAKVRLAGLLALCKTLYCGAYKYSYEVLEALIGFRDPNVVPIKDFYEPSTKINYFARLISDGSPNVRQHFYRVVGEWLTRLPDKQDHQGRLVPYLLTGLFDDSTQIQSLVAGIIQEIGAQYQQENEEKLRETKQFAIDSAWT